MIDELTDWYQPFPPAKAVDSDEEPAGGAQVGDVVELRVDGAQATNAFSVGRRRSEAVEGPAGAGGQPAPAAAAPAAPALAQ